jgi:hypothetical protein
MLCMFCLPNKPVPYLGEDMDRGNTRRKASTASTAMGIVISDQTVARAASSTAHRPSSIARHTQPLARGGRSRFPAAPALRPEPLPSDRSPASERWSRGRRRTSAMVRDEASTSSTRRRTGATPPGGHPPTDAAEMRLWVPLAASEQYGAAAQRARATVEISLGGG